MELHFTRTNGPVDDLIDRLLRQAGDVQHPEIVREMILAALKSGQENEDRIDLKIMNSTLKEMRFTAKVFSPYRQVKKVTVFGSARTRPEDPIYKMAQEFGRKLSAAGYMVITGGGPGIMQAVNEGAGPENSFGVNIRLPFEQQMNPVFANNPRSITYKYFFNRKVAFLKESDAVALFPGDSARWTKRWKRSPWFKQERGRPCRSFLLMSREALTGQDGSTSWKRNFWKEDISIKRIWIFLKGWILWRMRSIRSKSFILAITACGMLEKNLSSDS